MRHMYLVHVHKGRRKPCFNMVDYFLPPVFQWSYIVPIHVEVLQQFFSVRLFNSISLITVFVVICITLPLLSFSENKQLKNVTHVNPDSFFFITFKSWEN